MLEIWDLYKWYILGAASAIVAVVLLIVLIVKMVKKSHFKRDLSLQNGIKNEKSILAHKRYILKYLAKNPDCLERNPLIARIWLKKLNEKGDSKILNALMTYGAGKYQFDCFMAALEKKKLMEIYYPYLQGEDDMYRIEKLAQSCHGRDFDAQKAEPFLKGSLYSLRDLTGSPNWHNRFFAYNLLIHSDNEKAIRTLWEGIKDPHPDVRSLIIRKLKTSDGEAFYQQLKDVFIHDTSLDVRKEARKRIYGEFRSFFDLKLEDMDSLEQRRVVELLDTESDRDRNFALEMLQGESDILAQSAVTFLNNAKVLVQLFNGVKCSDLGEMERVEGLLRRSIQVGSEEFFNSQEAWLKEGPQLLASRILQEMGGVEWIDKLAESVFSKNPMGSDFSWEIYINTLKAVDNRGSDRTLQLKSQEILKYRNDQDILCYLLTTIPERQQYLFKDVLMDLFRQTDLGCHDSLREKLSHFNPSLITHDLLGILKNSNSGLKIKQEALKLLILLKQPYSIQVILESLPYLDFTDLVEFQEHLAFYDGKDFQQRVESLLNSYDATLRAAIISILPKKSALKYQSTIEESLKDSYADVRIAAAYKLLSMKKIESKEDHLILLKDPVDRVRIASARIFAEIGSKEAIEELSKIINNDEEIITVRKSVIQALTEAKESNCLEPVMDFLEHKDILEDFTIQVLASRKDSSHVGKVVEHFRDASPVLREKLINVFMAMGEDVEDTLADLLAEQVASLKEYLVEIMEKSGYIENLQRKLSHRNPAVRRRTTEILSLIGTKSAFKGIILASKDPDPQVRVNVTKALEKLNSPEGKALLKELEGDPETRVRKYTQWALERIKVKGQL